MPLDGGPWESIEKQKEKAVDVAPEVAAGFWKSDITGGDSGTFFDEGGGGDATRKIPLSYYTKASAWASDYPLIYRRVMGFINPYPGGIRPRDGDGRDRPFSLDEYVLREFGCRVDALVKLIADGWFVPLLADESEYPDRTREEITELFDAVRAEETVYEVEPRYVNLVDLALGAAATKNPNVAEKYARADGDNRVDIDETIRAWQREDHRYSPNEWHEWEAIPEEEFDVNGVSHPNLREYVLERAIKLELADDVIGTFTGDGDRIGNIRRTARRFVEASGTAARDELREDLVSQVYTQWNQLGTPAYYCDFSNTFDVGPAPLENTWVKQLKGWFDSLYQRFKRKLRELSNRIGLTEVETRPAAPEAIPLPSAPGVRLSTVFSVGPEDVSSSSLAIPDSLVERADAYGNYYHELRSNGTERASEQQIRKADSYPELLEYGEAGQDSTYVKQLGTNAADAIVIGDTAQSILQAGSDVSSLLGGLEAVSSAVEPTTAGVLAGVGKSILQLPEYHAETGDVLEPRITNRDDATYGDVWRFPYGDGNIRMNRLKYVARESIMETLSLPSLPSHTG